jgi:hypothetical protein
MFDLVTVRGAGIYEKCGSVVIGLFGILKRDARSVLLSGSDGNPARGKECEGQKSH